MHFRILQSNLPPLDSWPHHKCIHGSLHVILWFRSCSRGAGSGGWGEGGCRRCPWGRLQRAQLRKVEHVGRRRGRVTRWLWVHTSEEFKLMEVKRVYFTKQLGCTARLLEHHCLSAWGTSDDESRSLPAKDTCSLRFLSGRWQQSRSTRHVGGQVTKEVVSPPLNLSKSWLQLGPYWLLVSSSVLANLLALDFKYILQRDWRTILLSGHWAMMKVVSGWRKGRTCQRRVGWNTRLPSLSGRPRVCRQPTFWQTAHECLLACISPLSNNLLMPRQYPNVKMACQRKITLKRDIEIQMMSLVVIANHRTRYIR